MIPLSNLSAAKELIGDIECDIAVNGLRAAADRANERLLEEVKRNPFALVTALVWSIKKGKDIPAAILHNFISNRLS